MTTWTCRLVDADSRATDIGTVDPALDAFIVALHAEPLPEGVLSWAHPAGSGARGKASQKANLANKTSKADWGESPHNYGLAVDSYPIVLDGNGKKVVSSDPKHYALLGVIARRLALGWGGAWAKFPDAPHVEIPGWKTVVQTALGAGWPRKA